MSWWSDFVETITGGGDDDNNIVDTVITGLVLGGGQVLNETFDTASEQVDTGFEVIEQISDNLVDQIDSVNSSILT